METKICSICNQEKPVSDFYAKPQDRCRKCHISYQVNRVKNSKKLLIHIAIKRAAQCGKAQQYMAYGINITKYVHNVLEMGGWRVFGEEIINHIIPKVFFPDTEYGIELMWRKCNLELISKEQNQAMGPAIPWTKIYNDPELRALAEEINLPLNIYVRKVDKALRNTYRFHGGRVISSSTRVPVDPMIQTIANVYNIPFEWLMTRVQFVVPKSLSKAVKE